MLKCKKCGRVREDKIKDGICLWCKMVEVRRKNNSYVAWNKGLKAEEDDRVKNSIEKTRKALMNRTAEEKKKHCEKMVNTRKKKGSYDAAWNSGLTKEDHPSLLKISKSLKDKPTNRVPWNKGLTKYDDLRIKKVGDNNSELLFGSIPWNKKNKIKRKINLSEKLLHQCSERLDSIKRKRIKNRDLNRCVLSSIKDDFIGILGIHHINGDKYNNKDENLITLSRNYHPIVHTRFFRFWEGILEEWIRVASEYKGDYRVIW